MKKTGITLLSLTVVFTITAMPLKADVNKGAKIYSKLCQNCHGNPTKGAAMHTRLEWEDLFAYEGADMIKIHKTGTQAVHAKKGVSQRDAKKIQRLISKSGADLLDFLRYYANDSGNLYKPD